MFNAMVSWLAPVVGEAMAKVITIIITLVLAAAAAFGVYRLIGYIQNRMATEEGPVTAVKQSTTFADGSTREITVENNGERHIVRDKDGNVVSNEWFETKQ